jgi:hypothetical protein
MAAKNHQTLNHAKRCGTFWKALVSQKAVELALAARAAGPLKATGCANADGDMNGRDRRIAHGRALAAYRVGPKRRQPQENEYRPALHWLPSTGSRKDAQAV